MIEIRLKDLLDEAQHVNRFIATQREPEIADRFWSVMDYFATCLRTYTLDQRKVWEGCGKKDGDEYKAGIRRLEDEDLRHDHVAVPVKEMGPISIDVFGALIKLGVVTRGE